MCGIIGALLRGGKASEVIFSGLKRLEYRGYDSVGVATLDAGKIFIKKDRGKIEEVDNALDLRDMPGRLGIGHTRWATHGLPAKMNAHPLTDCKGTISVVHNGIIENFLLLREELMERGHVFSSNTDTEIIAHLVEEELEEDESFPKAVLRALRHLRGSFALAILSTRHPDTLIGVRKESPMIVGLDEEGYYLASDALAFLNRTNKVIYVEDWRMVVMKPDSIGVLDAKTGLPEEYEVESIDWTPTQMDRGGYSHFMAKEIFEQAYTIGDALRTPLKYVERFVEYLIDSERIFFVSCGTSYHAAVLASYLFPKISMIDVVPVVASEFASRYSPIIDEDTVVVAISQSGETADTLEAVRKAKEREARILGIVNVMGSTLTRLSECYIGQNSGPEIGVAATKTYTSQIGILSRLAIYAALKNNQLTIMESKRLLRNLHRVPMTVRRNMRRFDREAMRIAQRLVDKPSMCFLGRGVNYPTAIEARLKMLEITYKPAMAYTSGESKHGFISLVEEGYPIIIFAPTDECYEDNLGTIMEMKAREGMVIVVTDEEGREAMEMADDCIRVPKSHPFFSPILNVIPAHLLAYHTSVDMGLDPDMPRNLAKSVTVK
jgi:glucosamine--fructose-6-phosphate aminotransferase (isomerizing)